MSFLANSDSFLKKKILIDSKREHFFFLNEVEEDVIREVDADARVRWKQMIGCGDSTEGKW